MQSPPLVSSASIPFRWEEAPGKPRPASAAAPYSGKKAAAGGCLLDLPPRLLNDCKITVMPSPTAALDGPYVGRSLSLACTFSFRRGPAAGREDGQRPGGRGCGKFGSERWGAHAGGERKSGRGSLEISHTLGDFFRSEKNVKMTMRVRKRKSFFGLC